MKILALTCLLASSCFAATVSYGIVKDGKGNPLPMIQKFTDGKWTDTIAVDASNPDYQAFVAWNNAQTVKLVIPAAPAKRKAEEDFATDIDSLSAAQKDALLKHLLARALESNPDLITKAGVPITPTK